LRWKARISVATGRGHDTARANPGFPDRISRGSDTPEPIRSAMSPFCDNTFATSYLQGPYRARSTTDRERIPTPARLTGGGVSG
jgi:hypothetical protein